MLRTLLYIGEDHNIARVLNQVVVQDLRCDLLRSYDIAEGIIAAQDHPFVWVLLDAVTDYDDGLTTLRLLRARSPVHPFACMVIVGRHITTRELTALMDAGADDVIASNLLHHPVFASALRRQW
jgi:DNA-binding response OmpR family regulator